MKSWSFSKAPQNMMEKALNSPTPGPGRVKCRLVAFPRGQVVWRCPTRKLKAHACRKGKGKSFSAQRFVAKRSDGKCPAKK